nr:ribonuclease H-like domain-containing protein [Tanacetum cinerariifolium]
MFDLDYQTNSTNYEPVSVENQANKSVGPKEANNSSGTQAIDDQGVNSKEIDLNKEHFVLPIWSAYSTTIKSSGNKIKKNTSFKTCEKPVSQVEQVFLEELEKLKRQKKEANNAAESLRKEATHDIQHTSTSSTNLINTASTPLSTAGLSRAFNDGSLLYLDPSKYDLLDDHSMPHLEEIYASTSEGIFTGSSYDNEGVVTDFNNLETIVNVSPTSTIRIHTIHLKTQILGDPNSAVQTHSKVNKNFEAHALFQIQKVLILVDLPFGKKAIGTIWVYRNKKDERGVLVRNKARLVSHGH